MTGRIFGYELQSLDIQYNDIYERLTWADVNSRRERSAHPF